MWDCDNFLDFLGFKNPHYNWAPGTQVMNNCKSAVN